jgi:hypothetical protein
LNGRMDKARNPSFHGSKVEESFQTRLKVPYWGETFPGGKPFASLQKNVLFQVQADSSWLDGWGLHICIVHTSECPSGVHCRSPRFPKSLRPFQVPLTNFNKVHSHLSGGGLTEEVGLGPRKGVPLSQCQAFAPSAASASAPPAALLGLSGPLAPVARNSGP